MQQGVETDLIYKSENLMAGIKKARNEKELLTYEEVFGERNNMETRFSPVLERAVELLIPGYFSWDEDSQNKYRIFMPDDLNFKFRQFILKEAFGIEVADDDAFDDAWSDMSTQDTTKFNAILLPLQGIGEDLFFLNEYFAIGKSLLDFETLYEYDFNDFQFQEADRKTRENYCARTYRGSLHSVWARLLIDGDFYYASLSMVSRYLAMELGNFGDDYIEERIPYDFYPGEDHGKASANGCSVYDMRINANGLESQLKELQKRTWKYLEIAEDRIEEDYDKQSEQQVLILDQSSDKDPYLHILFSDWKVLQKIRFQTFMRDCRAFENKDHSALLQQLADEKAKLKIFLDEQYAEIMSSGTESG